MGEILKVEGLSKQFTKKNLFGSKISTVKAVEDVTFSLHDDEVLVIAGESGSGKSTIAKLILRGITPDSGKVVFDGEEISDNADSMMKIRMNCQMVHQDPYDSINPRMKVKDIVSEPLEIHNVGDSQERKKIVLNALREVKLEPVEEIANIQLGRRYNLNAPKGVRGRSSENTMIKERLGWAPSVPLVEGMRNTYAWIYEQMKPRYM